MPNVLMGASPLIREVYREILEVSKSRATILLRGESGTGKELVARIIHENSPRAGAPFIRVNCSALTETLIASELFGHEKGSFTGATHRRKGRFEIAHGGTLFLDEVGDLSPLVQVSLLRVLQEREFERVGDTRPISIDVRIVAATHRDLEAATRNGTFRHDLYYRLNVVPIFLPPLRDRREDIPLLTDYFLDKFNGENNKKVHLERDVTDLMCRYEWPGNVRELQNCVERLVLLSRETRVTLKNIPSAIRTYFSDVQKVTPPKKPQASLAESLQEMERSSLIAALDKSGWVLARAARALALTPRQISYKIKKYGLHPPSM